MTVTQNRDSHLPPHLRTTETVRGMTWKWIAALVPAVAVKIFFQGIPAAALIALSVAGAAVAKAAFSPLTLPLSPPGRGQGEGRARLFFDGHLIFISFLFGLLLPPVTPLWMAVLGSFFAVFVGREIFGGTGATPFHPALAGYAFLILNFPWLEAPVMGGKESLIFAGALAAGGWILFAFKLIRGEVPFLYLSLIFFLSQAGGYEARTFLLNPGVLLSAFFCLSDFGTTPLTQYGRRISALGAAFLTMTFAAGFGPSASAAFAVLTMNTITPWLDHGMSSVRRSKS